MKFLTTIFAILIIGCQQTKDDLIASPKGRYWDVVRDGKHIFNKPAYCYLLKSNGICIYYYYKKEENKIVRKLFDYGDVVYPSRWEINMDTLKIKGFNYQIQSISKDTIVLLSEAKPVDTLILSISNHQ